jgi:hypothetical protein
MPGTIKAFVPARPGLGKRLQMKMQVIDMPVIAETSARYLAFG